MVRDQVDHNLVSEGEGALQSYFDIYENKFGKVSACGVAATLCSPDISQYNNSLKHVFHVKAAEIEQRDRVVDCRILETSILNILDTAMAMNSETLAVPALGVKSKGFQTAECAEAMLYWIIEWCHLPETGSLKTIKIVNADPAISEQFQTTLL